MTALELDVIDSVDQNHWALPAKLNLRFCPAGNSGALFGCAFQQQT